MHQRLVPKKHRFVYDVFMFALDLDELDALAQKLKFFSRNRFNLYAFWDKDHLERDGRTAKAQVLDYLSRYGIDLKGGRIMLLTYVRTMGYVFNPVSFYFCSDAAGEPVCVVAEVGNTFGEKKPYLLSGEHRAGKDLFSRRVKKLFYVSPFMDLDIDFDFRLRLPSDTLDLHVDDYKGEELVLVSSLTGRKVPMTDWNLLRLTLLYPLMTLKVIGLIHWHAALLWAKKIPFFRKSENVSKQKDLYHPHVST
jgi:DUF1365 family protein